MLKGKKMKLRSMQGREVYITITESNIYSTPSGDKTFVKYIQKDNDFNTVKELEDSLQYVQEHYFEL